MSTITIPDMQWIIDFENGELETTEVIDGFANLIKTGTAWTLQGFYGRTAEYLIDAGYISPEGEVLKYDDEDN